MEIYLKHEYLILKCWMQNGIKLAEVVKLDATISIKFDAISIKLQYTLSKLSLMLP